jgi:hypothetical protein
MRNVLARVPKGSHEMVAAAIRTIFAQPDRAAVAEQLSQVAGKLGRQFPQVEVLLCEAEYDITAFAAFPAAHWRRIWSTDESVKPPAGGRVCDRGQARVTPYRRAGRGEEGPAAQCPSRAATDAPPWRHPRRSPPAASASGR